MNRDNSLDGLRGLACLAVFSGHFLYVMFPYLAIGRVQDHSGFIARWPWEGWFSAPPFTILYNGDFAVSVFFVLSGYVLMRKFWKTGDRSVLVDGMLKRYPRLIFPAAAAVGVAFVLMRLGAMHAQVIPDDSFAGWVRDLYTHIPSTKRALFAGFVGVPFIGDANALAWNGPLWTLRIELLGSVLLFAVFLVFGESKRGTAAVFVLISLYVGMPLYFIPFIVGAFLNGAVDWLKRRPAISVGFFVLGVICGCFDYASWLQPMEAVVPRGQDPRAFWYAIGASFMVAGVIGSAPLARFFGSRVNSFLGRISFSLYLLHWPIIFSFSIWAVERYQKLGVSYMHAAWATYASTALLLILLSDCFHRFIDKPAMRFADLLAGWVLVPRKTRIDSKELVQGGEHV